VESSADTVECAHAVGRRRWPSLALDAATFARHVTRLGLCAEPLAARAEDLFLVAAVLERLPNADGRLEEYLRIAARGASRVDRDPAFLDEVEQELRVVLLTGNPPKLATYLAAGALLDWLRVVAVRLALNMKRKIQPLPIDDLAQVVAPDDAREGERWGLFYRDDLQRALEVAFAKLSTRERNLLRLHFVDGLNIGRLGEMYGAHRATIARWLVSIRRKLLEMTKSQLAVQHGLDTSDVRSLYHQMERDVHISVSRILAD
jgi:RNA polymerase sigma-70 factor, ECF subfamily